MSETYTLMHIPMRLVETVQGIASGTMVAVPREPAPDFWPSYCAANNAMPGSAWDILSQRLYRAIIRHTAAQPRRDGGNGDG